MVCVIFLIFCWTSFINFIEAQFFRTLKLLKLKYLEINLFKKKNNLHIVLKNISAQVSWKNFFFFFRKKIISRTWGFFCDCKTTDLGLIFFHKKLILYFFQVWLFNFKIVLKTCFKNLFGKTEKMVILLFQISQSNPTSDLF